MRRKARYQIRLDNRRVPHRVSGALFWDWVNRGFVKKTGPHTGRIAEGYTAWLDEGTLRLQSIWSAIGPYIKTNSRVFEMLAVYAIWTPYLTPLELEWEIQAEYSTDRRWNELRIGADLGRTVFNDKSAEDGD